MFVFCVYHIIDLWFCQCLICNLFAAYVYYVRFHTQTKPVTSTALCIINNKWIVPGEMPDSKTASKTKDMKGV